MKIFTKDCLISELKSIADRGWIESKRLGNAGSVGNTLEDLLGIEENNLPIPNAAEWELKTQRFETSSLTTLFHSEPSPRAMKFVPQILLPLYGWPHQEAGLKYPSTEMSFRQTLNGTTHTDRGFKVDVNKDERKVLITFDASKIDERHENWAHCVEKKIGLSELNPQPYWGFDDLANKAGTKLLNCFFVQAKIKKENSKEYYHYCKILMLQKFNFEGFLSALETGDVLIDFDARSGHNHGTKFRLKQNSLPLLYDKITEIL